MTLAYNLVVVRYVAVRVEGTVCVPKSLCEGDVFVAAYTMIFASELELGQQKAIHVATTKVSLDW